MARYNSSVFLPTLLGVAALATGGPALAAPGETLLYGGQALGQRGIMVTPWGGGTVLDSTDFSMFSGANDHAFQVTTLGPYQGAKINYDPPAALGEAADGKTRVLQLSIRPVKLAADPSTLTRGNRFGGGGGLDNGGMGQGGGQDNGYPGGGYPGASSPGGEGPDAGAPGGGYPGMGSPGGEGGPGAGGYPGAGGNAYPGRGGYPGGGSPNGYPGAGGEGQMGEGQMGEGQMGGGMMGEGQMGGMRRQRTPPSAPAIKTVRLLFTLADGRQADILRPIPTADKGADWIDLDVPLSVLKFSGKAAPDAAPGMLLKSVTVGGDIFGEFYVGRIRLLDDAAPIANASAGPEQNVRPGQPVGLHGSADGGASMLKYTWNFGTTDGQEQQAEGQDVVTQFPQAQGNKDYTVTLTVSDLDGIKKPVTATTVIHVLRGRRGGYPGGQPGGGYPGAGYPGAGYPGAGYPGGGSPGGGGMPGGGSPGGGSPGGEMPGMSSPGG